MTIGNLNAQGKWDTKEEKHNNGVVLTGLIDFNSKKLITIQPKGKNATIIYDPYFDKYQINWLDKENFQKQIDLSGGVETSYGIIYKDQDGAEIFVINTLKENGKLELVIAKPIEIDGKKVKLFYHFEDFN